MKAQAVLVALLLATPALAQQNKWRDDFKRHWKTSKEFTLAVAEAMPAESYRFKPDPEQMSFGELMFHIAFSNALRFAQVGETKSGLSKPPNLDKPAALQWLNDSFDYCEKVFDGLTQAQLDKMFRVDWHGLPETTGREVLTGMFTHTAHHRGQAEVYLRVKGIKPPIYRF